MLDGNSIYIAHVWGKIGLIGWKHTIYFRSNALNRWNDRESSLCAHHISELPSNISTMDFFYIVIFHSHHFATCEKKEFLDGRPLFRQLLMYVQEVLTKFIIHIVLDILCIWRYINLLNVIFYILFFKFFFWLSVVFSDRIKSSNM